MMITRPTRPETFYSRGLKALKTQGNPTTPTTPTIYVRLRARFCLIKFLFLNLFLF
jgi:hypothetical protein